MSSLSAFFSTWSTMSVKLALRASRFLMFFIS